MSETPTVVVNGSPMPSVTGFSPCGVTARRVTSLLSVGLTRPSAARVDALAPLPGWRSALVTVCSASATERVLCWTV